MQQGAEQPGRASHGTQEVCSGVEQGRARCGGVWCVEGGTTKEKGACACGLAVCGRVGSLFFSAEEKLWESRESTCEPR